MDQFAYVIGTGSLGLAAFLVVLAILWLLVPFALFGIKPILRDILTEMRRRNGTLPEEQKSTLPDSPWKQSLKPASSRDREHSPPR